MNEIWKDIPNYKGIYQVSNLGRVKGLERLVRNGSGYRTEKESILKQKVNNKYLRVVLQVRGVRKAHSVHQLVAEAFLEHKRCGMSWVVDHIDNNPRNNHVDNLQVISNRENCTKNIKEGVGATYDKRHDNWISRVVFKGKQRCLGVFKTKEEAVNARLQFLEDNDLK